MALFARFRRKLENIILLKRFVCHKYIIILNNRLRNTVYVFQRHYLITLHVFIWEDPLETRQSFKKWIYQIRFYWDSHERFMNSDNKCDTAHASLKILDQYCTYSKQPRMSSFIPKERGSYNLHYNEVRIQFLRAATHAVMVNNKDSFSNKIH